MSTRIAPGDGRGWAKERRARRRIALGGEPASATRGPEDDLHPPVEGASFRSGVRRHRVLWSVGEDAEPAGGEVHRGLLLEPSLHREGALLGELHVGLGVALAVGVAVDLDRGSAGDEQVAQRAGPGLLAPRA